MYENRLLVVSKRLPQFRFAQNSIVFLFPVYEYVQCQNAQKCILNTTWKESQNGKRLFKLCGVSTSHSITLKFGYSFIYIVIIPTNGNTPRARPTISLFVSHNWPGAYSPLSSTELLSPLVRNLTVPLFL